MIVFQTMTDEQHAPLVIEMMEALFAGEAIHTEGAPHHAVYANGFPRTIQYLLTSSECGRIVLFVEEEQVLGYGLLIPYWSNEFGGHLVFIDELFVRPEARGQGIAKTFFQWLHQERPFDAVAFALEVSPGNEKARRLYESLGFYARAYSTMICPLDN